MFCLSKKILMQVYTSKNSSHPSIKCTNFFLNFTWNDVDVGDKVLGCFEVGMSFKWKSFYLRVFNDNNKVLALPLAHINMQ